MSVGELTIEQRIEQLERIVSHLLQHCPMPRGGYFASPSEELLLTAAADIQDRAWKSELKIRGELK